MNKRNIPIYLVCIWLLMVTHLAYPMDWKDLHEKVEGKPASETIARYEKGSDSVEELYLLGLAYLNLHKDKEADTIFQKMAGIDPRSKEAQWGMAECLRREHKLNESEKILTALIQEDAEFSPAYISLAYIRYIRMDFNGSLRLAEKVMRQGKEKTDLRNYVRAILLVAGNKGMLAHRGGVVSKILHGTTVLSYLKKAQALTPDNAEVLFGIGSFYLLAPPIAGGDLGKARRYLEQATNEDPSFAEAFVRLAQVYKVRGDNSRYEFYLKKAIQIDPKNELALDIERGTCNFICVDR